MIYPRPFIRTNWRRTGQTRFRECHIRRIFKRNARAVIVLQLQWECDVVDVNSRQTRETQTEWRDATADDLINNDLMVAATVT